MKRRVVYFGEAPLWSIQVGNMIDAVVIGAFGLYCIAAGIGILCSIFVPR
jgi:hypothetical protein